MLAISNRATSKRPGQCISETTTGLHLTVERLTNDLRRGLRKHRGSGAKRSQTAGMGMANFDIKDIAKQTLQFYEDTLAGRS